MSVGPFLTSLHFGKDKCFGFVIDPINDSKVTHADSVKGPMELLASDRARILFQILDCP